MICKESEAINFICCIHMRQCQGQNCMAWKWKYVIVQKDKGENSKAFPPRPKIANQRTDEGYCGLVYK